jgi:uncharacterized Fe-S center protein
VDPALTPLQVRSLFDTLKDQEGKVAVYQLMNNLTGQECETVDFKRNTEKKLSNYIMLNDLLP